MARSLGAGEQRDQLLNMAAIWDKLAADRSQLVRNHPELGVEGEHQEEIDRRDRIKE